MPARNILVELAGFVLGLALGLGLCLLLGLPLRHAGSGGLALAPVLAGGLCGGMAWALARRWTNRPGYRTQHPGEDEHPDPEP